MTNVIVLKEIKPSKFEQKAFMREFTAEAKRSARDMTKDYRKTTVKWKRKPKWQTIIRMGPRAIEILVGTDNEIYAYIDLGTRKHWIFPRRRKVLRWIGTSYRGRGGRGRPRKSDYAYSMGHEVSGIKARHYSKKIQKVWNKKFKRRMEAALRRGVRASGHQIK